MRFYLPAFCALLLFGAGSAAELVTRLHHFEYASPALVEKQIRALVPEGPRVSMNARDKKVIVIADAETHARIASMLRHLGRPPMRLKFTIRHNHDEREFAIADGVPISLPVSQTPPKALVALARGQLAPEVRDLPVVGSALEAHVLLLREDPAVIRLRVVPAVVFGALQPYQVVDFPELAMDIMVDTENFVELREQLKPHDFYRRFLLTQPDPAASPRPVSLLISFDGLEPVPSGSAPEPEDDDED